MKAVQQQINSYIRKHGVKKLAKKLGVKTMMRLGLGTGLSASGVGTAVGLGLTAWTLFDIYHIFIFKWSFTMRHHYFLKIILKFIIRIQ